MLTSCCDIVRWRYEDHHPGAQVSESRVWVYLGPEGKDGASSVPEVLGGVGAAMTPHRIQRGAIAILAFVAAAVVSWSWWAR